MMMQLIDQNAPLLGVAPLCDALNVARASYYRWKHPVHGPRRPRSSARALSVQERQDVLDALHEPRFVDKAPAEVYATLLDEGTYVGSIRTYYRVLAKHQEVKERRAICSHPNYRKPELLARGPNELWSWDITKLRGPTPGTYFYLYVILDVFSRYVVGWMVASCESEELARELIDQAYSGQRVEKGQLTLHSDRGPSMTSHGVARLLADLGVQKSHSRPYVSDDNPYSEAQFKTLKYRHDFPGRFGSVEDARVFCRKFFPWYNDEHHHSGLAMLTPHDVHHGLADARTAHRAAVLTDAHRAHPERFVHGVPVPHAPPREVWINPPPRRTTPSPMPSTPPSASGAADALGGAEVRGRGGAAPVVTTEEVLH
jgi:putative transposase